MNSTERKASIKQQSADLSKVLIIPVDELLELVTLAGLTAMTDTLRQQGGIAFPLKLSTSTHKERIAINGSIFTGILRATEPPPWAGFHYNSKAYAQAMAGYLREHCPNEEMAAEWYRNIRGREIPPVPTTTIERVQG